MKSAVRPITLLFLIILFSPVALATNSAPDKLFILGDSLSENGNSAIYNQMDLPPPFYNNRISNGPVVVDILAAHYGIELQPALGGGTNYAVAGARAAGSNLGDLAFQVQTFKSHYPAGAPANSVFVVFIGGNDVRDARDTFSMETALATLDQAVGAIGTAIRDLIDHGAERILVINGPDLGKIPETRMIAAELGDWFIDAATVKSRAFNAKLFWEVAQIKWQTRKHIRQFNLFYTFNEVLEDADEHGISNTTDACFNPYVVPFEFRPDCDFSKFAFFDAIHPTAKVHALIGGELVKFVSHRHRRPHIYAHHEHDHDD